MNEPALAGGCRPRRRAYGLDSSNQLIPPLPQATEPEDTLEVGK